MSLQFLLGNSGSGKSHILYQTILEDAQKHQDKKYLIIVPEQFTLQTQKELVELSPSHGILNIDILSFQRLAYRVLGETGGSEYPVLEETGKSLVVQRVVQEQRKNLGVLAGNLKRAGTVSEMKSLVSELMQYDILPSQMDEILSRSEEKPLLFQKLSDVRLIYEGFLNYLKDRYITGEEILEVLWDKIGESSLMKNCQVVFDGFTGFTPVQNKVVQKILGLAEKVWVTVTWDWRVSRERAKSPQNLFHMSGSMIQQLEQMAKEEKVEILQNLFIRPGEKSRFSHSPALNFLEQNLFRYKTSSYEEEQKEIQIFSALNPHEEMEEIVRRICYLVRTKGYRYGEIGVVTGDLPTYGSYARQVMEENHLPYFVDEKHTVLMNPFVEFLRAVFNMLTEGFTYESVFRYLRCGLSTLDLFEIDQLENYCIGVGITGWKKWKEPWVWKYRGLSEEELEQINGIREKFLEEIQEFADNIMKKNLTVEERTRYLYDFIVKTEIQKKLKEKEEYFEEKGRLALVKEYRQIYGIIMELLDKVVQILGKETMSLSEYQQILETGFLESSVGIIPPSADQVLIGDIERTRLKDIRVLFFAGVNDSVIPKRGGASGLLSESDREFLKDRKVELAPTSRESMYIQRFYLYLNMTKPADRLYLSYGKVSRDGQSLSPAFLIPLMTRLFPKIQIQEVDSMDISSAEQPEQSIGSLLQGFHCEQEEEEEKQWKELLSWYLSSPEWEDRCRKWIRYVFYQKPEDHIGKIVARALYGRELNNSATELERFAACGFAHFLQFGLELSQRQKFEFHATDMGNILHQALEQFARNLKKHHLAWRDLSQKERDAVIDESVDQIVSDYGNTILESSARNQYMVTRVKRILRRTVWALQEQIKVGKYEPHRFEISFAMEEDLQAANFQLSRDEQLHLKGRIDRVDCYEENDTVYVKVIDYKSGNTSMDLIALYYGLQLQLVVYMNGAMELEQKMNPDKKIEPAGIFYYRVKDPLTDGTMEEDEESISRRILQELKVNGLVREEEKVIHDMDETLAPGKKSMVIPVSYNKNGSLSRYSQTASLEQFQTMSEYVNHKIKEIGRSILDGNVDINPYKFRNKKACDYCSYREICGFDEKIPGYHYRKLPAFSQEELWENMKKEEES